MNSTDPLTEAMHRMFPTEQAPVELAYRVATFRSRRIRTARWYALGATCAAASAVAAAFFLAPSTVLADVLLKEAGDLQGHLTIYVVHAGGSRSEVGEAWTQGGKLREQFYGRWKAVHVLDPEKNVDVTWRRDADTVLFHHKPSRFGQMMPPDVLTSDTLSAFIKRNQWLHAPKTSRATYEGRRVDCVTVTGNPSIRGSVSLEVSIYADPESHRVLAVKSLLPKELTRHHSEIIGWLTAVEPMSPPKDAFEPVFNINGVKTNVYDQRTQWAARLAKPLDTFEISGGAIDVRSVTRNAAGDVFVLYTGLHAPYGQDVIPSNVTDGSQGVYLKGGGFTASDRGPSDDYQPFKFDGRLLDGAWFVRRSGGPPKGPVTLGFRKEGDPENEFACRYIGTPEPLTDAVPAYMPYMAMGINNAAAWRAERDIRLAGQFEYEKAFASAEQSLRSYIREVETNPSQTNMGLDASSYFDLSRVVEEQGRLGEALEIMLKAQELTHGNSWGSQKIKTALIRLRQETKL